ncbi:MAG: DNA replication/repair protein RecF [bacterium]
MYLTHLRLRNWRNIAAADLDLSPGLTIFAGPNAQGKTNILESVHFLATASSHRTRRDRELIQWGQPATHIRCEVTSGTTSHKLECGLEHSNRILKRDDQPLARVGDLYGTLRVTLFAPEDLEIIHGGPDRRRRFVDMTVAQMRAGYVRLLQTYRRALRQRNGILRSTRPGCQKSHDEQLDIWDASVAELGGQVVAARREAIGKLTPIFQSHYNGLAAEETAALNYETRSEGESAAEIAESILTLLTTHRASDLDRGSTGYGPHRDDISIELENRPLAVFGSQGQRRTGALALRLAEAQLLEEESGESPVLLVDDVIYEMDQERRRRFWERIPDQYQLLVTATDHRELAAARRCGGMFHVNSGSLHPDRP